MKLGVNKELNRKHNFINKNRFWNHKYSNVRVNAIIITIFGYSVNGFVFTQGQKK